MTSYFPHEMPDDLLLGHRFNITNNQFRFNYQAAAEYFNVSTRTIRRWLSSGKLPPHVRELLLIEYRGLPIKNGWEKFYFHQGILYTPYEKFNFTPSKLLATWYLINAPKSYQNPNWELFLKASTGSLYGAKV